MAANQEGWMPVTAKLSRKFYEKLGDDIADELVEWFNTVDSSQRDAFREMFDAQFARLDTRISEQSLRLEILIGAVESRLQSRMEAIDTRVDAKLEALKSDLLKWMFLFWVGTMGTVLAILKL
jgi:hypothetical protein